MQSSNLEENYQPKITGAATTITDSNLTASRALISDSSGKIGVSSTITSTELGYLNNVSGNIQTQLNGKADLNVSIIKKGLGITGIGTLIKMNFNSIAKNDDGTIYIGVGDGIIACCTNDEYAINNWTVIRSDIPLNFVRVIFDGSLFIILNDDGQVITLDHNNSYTLTTKKSFGKAMYDISYMNGIYVVCGEGFIYYSEDLTSWTTVSISGKIFRRLMCLSTNRWLAVGDNGVVYTSSNNAKSWKVCTLSETTTENFYAIGCSSSNDIYIGGTNGVVYRSSNLAITETFQKVSHSLITGVIKEILMAPYGGYMVFTGSFGAYIIPHAFTKADKIHSSTVYSALLNLDKGIIILSIRDRVVYTDCLTFLTEEKMETLVLTMWESYNSSTTEE